MHSTAALPSWCRNVAPILGIMQSKPTPFYLRSTLPSTRCFYKKGRPIHHIHLPSLSPHSLPIFPSPPIPSSPPKKTPHSPPPLKRRHTARRRKPTLRRTHRLPRSRPPTRRQRQRRREPLEISRQAPRRRERHRRRRVTARGGGVGRERMGRGRKGRHAAAGCCWWGDEAWWRGAVGAGGHERGWGHAGCGKGEEGEVLVLFSMRIRFGRA